MIKKKAGPGEDGSKCCYIRHTCFEFPRAGILIGNNGDCQMQFARTSVFISALVLAGFSLGWMASSVGDAKNQVVLPIKLTQSDLAGGAFERFTSVDITHEMAGQTWETKDAEIFLSPDKQFDAGVYKSGPVRMDITEDYGLQEFMYFLEGRVILTSRDGSSVEVGPGEGVLISADWQGIWDSPQGYRKIYVIYSPNGPITE